MENKQNPLINKESKYPTSDYMNKVYIFLLQMKPGKKYSLETAKENKTINDFLLTVKEFTFFYPNQNIEITNDYKYIYKYKFYDTDRA